MAVDAETLKAALELRRAAVLETFDGRQFYVFDSDFNDWVFTGHATLVPGFRANGPRVLRGEHSEIALHDARLVA